jgi:predicted dehydrogenase
MGLVGAGFIGPHHVDAVRRLGAVDVVAVAGSSESSARAAASRLGIPRSYGHYDQLLDDPDVTVVHVATPNHLHVPIAAAAIARGKHVVCEKPLARSAAEARTLLDAAIAAQVVHAVMFNYRGNPLVQQARTAVLRGDVGVPHLLHGSYLQDWLLTENDFSWRLEPEHGGPSSALGDIGSHWCDLAEYVSGRRIVQVLGELATVVRRRKKPAAHRDAFAGGGSDDRVEWIDVKVEDLATVLLRFDNGARGNLTIGQVCAGHKNDLSLEICGATGSIAWRQEAQNELWIGHRHRPNEVLQKDPALMDPASRRYANLPGGHQEGWADAFFNVMREIYDAVASGTKPGDSAPLFPTFADGYRATCVVEAIVASARAGGVWTAV